jgi:hypothetical protein
MAGEGGGNMVERRNLVGGGLVAGLASMMVPATDAAADDEQTTQAINRLRDTFERQFEQTYSSRWKGVSRVRQQQRTWIQATRKYPDFIEIGLDVWDNIWDWHVVYQQPLNVTRVADGRYAMSFMFTTLLLRPDVNPDFVGYSFDADARGRPR